jgi:hypothetical protein
VTPVVLVAGPARAGTSRLCAALTAALPAVSFVEAADAPTAALFAVSASTPVTSSDLALLDRVGRSTTLVIGVVTKVDAHRGWAGVLAANAALADVPWVPAAAAPSLGPPRLDELLALLTGRLADDDLARRNRLRVRAARAAELVRAQRDLTRQQRLSRAQRSVALRAGLQRARVQQLVAARAACTALRADLQLRPAAGIEAYGRDRAGDLLERVEGDLAERLTAVAVDLELPDAGPAGPSCDANEAAAQRFPPLTSASHALESRLMTVLGAGFGLGVALAVGRLLVGTLPAGLAAGAGALVGLTVTAVVVGIRGQLRDRAVRERWAAEFTSAVRAAADELIATRVLAADSALTAALVADEEVQRQRMAGRLAALDAERRMLGGVR